MFNKNKFEFFFFRILNKILLILGLKKVRKFANLLGAFIYYFIPIRKNIVIKNLRTAFPEKSFKEIKHIAKKNYQNISITFCELMLIPSLKLEEIKSQIYFDNLELIRKKSNDITGLIPLTGHFGNWEILISSIVAYINARYNVLVKPQRNEYITKWLKKTRSIGDTNVISVGVSVKEIIKAIKAGEVVMIAGDQRGPYEANRLKFFNKDTALFTGTASIALKTNCNVLLVAIVRQPDFKYKAYVEELSYAELPENDELKPIVLTQRYISFLEKYIRKYPEQYFWMHNIWKY